MTKSIWTPEHDIRVLVEHPKEGARFVHRRTVMLEQSTSTGLKTPLI